MASDDAGLRNAHSLVYHVNILENALWNPAVLSAHDQAHGSTKAVGI
jgi:hypothetical protein